MRAIERGHFTHGCAECSVVTTASAVRLLPGAQPRGERR